MVAVSSAVVAASPPAWCCWCFRSRCCCFFCCSCCCLLSCCCCLSCCLVLLVFPHLSLLLLSLLLNCCCFRCCRFSAAAAVERLQRRFRASIGELLIFLFTCCYPTCDGFETQDREKPRADRRKSCCCKNLRQEGSAELQKRVELQRET